MYNPRNLCFKSFSASVSFEFETRIMSTCMSTSRSNYFDMSVWKKHADHSTTYIQRVSFSHITCTNQWQSKTTIWTSDFRTCKRYNQACLLRRVSAIAHYHILTMVSRSVIFSTPKSGKNYTQFNTKCTPIAYLNILRSAICSTAGIFKRQGLKRYNRNSEATFIKSC